VSHLPFGPTAFFALRNTVLRHDIEDKETMSQQYPHLIFHNFSTSLGERVCSVNQIILRTFQVTSILKHIFPEPKEESERVVSFINQNDFISMR
jgi:U3 small nucleolar ribonucleoprotein protein IMP4